jgi:hypothetical protein
MRRPAGGGHQVLSGRRAALQSIKEQIIGKLKMIGTSNP